MDKIVANIQTVNGCTHEDALERFARIYTWVPDHETTENDVAWSKSLDGKDGKHTWFVDRVADVCNMSVFDAFQKLILHRDDITSLQQQTKNGTAAEAARVWLKKLRKANISKTAVQKLQTWSNMSEAQARELLIEHIDTMIHMDEVGGLDWDDAQSRWSWLYVTGSESPQQRPKKDDDKKEEVAPASASVLALRALRVSRHTLRFLNQRCSSGANATCAQTSVRGTETQNIHEITVVLKLKIFTKSLEY